MKEVSVLEAYEKCSLQILAWFVALPCCNLLVAFSTMDDVTREEALMCVGWVAIGYIVEGAGIGMPNLRIIDGGGWAVLSRLPQGLILVPIFLNFVSPFLTTS